MKMKNKSFIKIVAVMLLAVMVTLSFASCATGGKNVASDTSGEGWSYTKDGQTLVITSIAAYEGTATPWSAVTSSVKKVIVGNGITAIPDYAFYNMTALEAVEFQGSVATVGKLAFAFTPALKEITLPETVTAIGYGAFEASGLVAIKLPASVSVIEDRTFIFCDDLEAVVGAGVTSIKTDAFAHCASIKTVSVQDVAAVTAAAGAIFGEGATVPTIKPANVNTYTVTVDYVYEDGTQAFESVIRFCENGSHEFASPVKEGYTADKATVTVTVDGADVTEKVTYVKNPEETEAPVESESESVVETPEDDKLDFWTIAALVGTVVILIGVAVAVILYVRHDKKKNGAKGGKKAKK